TIGAYTMGPNGYPTQPAPIPFPAPGASPGGEFGANWGSTPLPRIDLNRGWRYYYPTVSATGQFNPSTTYAQYSLDYNLALQDRQQMTQEIFNVLLTVTGSGPVVGPGTGQFEGQRWLAQLAVNIVDYLQYPMPNWNQWVTPDDVMTPFYWNPNVARTDIKNG